MDRVLSLFLPDWPIDRVRRRWPAPKRRVPLLLAEWRGGSQVVTAGSPETFAQGVRAGMSVAEARALAPDSVVEPHKPVADAAALEALGRWAIRFSPRVAVDPPDGLLLDVTGCERLFRGEGNLLNQLLATVGSFGFAAYGAIADTIGAAWAVSHAGDGQPCVVARSQSFAALAHLPPWALRIEQQTISQLAALGIDHVEALLMLPRSTLPARFGDEMLRRIDQALGQVREDITPIAPSAHVSAGLRFDGAVRRVEVLELAVGQLLTHIVEALERRGRGATRLELTVYRERVAPLHRGVRLCVPSRNQRHLARLLRAQWERLDLSAGMEAVRLTVVEDKPMRAEQGDFFEAVDGSAYREAGELFDDLTGRLGPGRVLRPRLVEAHRPERSWRAEDIRDELLDSPRAMRSSNRSRPSRRNDCLPSADSRRLRDRDDDPVEPDVDAGHVCETPASQPLRLLPHPCPIEAMVVVPDQPPSWFRYRNREYRTRYGAGPQRICAAWWSENGGARDYYQIETEDGARFWVYREAESRRWFLHGVFE